MTFYVSLLTGAALGLVSFGLCLLVYLRLDSPGIDLADQWTDILPSLLNCVVVCALVTAVVGPRFSAQGSFVRHLRLTFGGVLIAQALLIYSLVIPEQIPMVVLFGGSFLASGLFAAGSRRRGGHLGQVVLVGYDRVMASLLTQERTLGVVAETPAEARDLPYLGHPRELISTVERVKPRQVIVCGEMWKQRDALAGALMECLHRGVRVSSALHLYEQERGRLPLAYLEPAQLLQSSYFSMNRQMLMAQAIYGNIAGLALLLLATPLLFGAVLLLLLAGGSGPLLDRSTCVGFQMVPFELLRFRTRGADGRLSAAGRLLLWLGLVNLPQLINVVRGEMTFLGPQPVRKEFADRMAQLIPFYPMRFFAKPGFWGWAQANEGSRCTDTLLTLEYDLFYVTEGSLDLELQILLRSLRW